MNRKELLHRVNQRLDGRLYRWDEVKYEFDDAISEINNKLQANFPMISDVLQTDNSEYVYYLAGEGSNIVTFGTDEIWEFNKPSPHGTNNSPATLPVFPEKYIRGIVIPFVVAKLLQREDEFGNLHSSINQEGINNLDNMFFEYYNDIPEYFIRGGGVFEWSSNHSRLNPFEINKPSDTKGPLDQ